MRSLAICLTAIVACLHMAGAMAQSLVEPGGTPSDEGLAANNPDEYAWQLFFFLNHQAKAGAAGIADDGKKFGELDPGASVVWESWALASGDNVSEVYRPGGAKPQPWDKLDRPKDRPLVLSRSLETEAVLADRSRGVPGTGFVPQLPDAEEVRMNRAAFEFITDDKIKMYNRDGLEALLGAARQAQNREFIAFPAAAKEVKAQWLPIDPSQKARYLWREANGKIFGLVALHVITKDLPNWFWADFGHVDCDTIPPVNACANQQFQVATRPVDRTTRGPDAKSGSEGVRNETRNTVWANYILRGTQTAFVTSVGESTILSNPVIEETFQQSSCMTCHARAAIGPRLRDANGNLLAGVNRLSTSNPALGAPNPTLYGADAGWIKPDILYLQTDFLWSPVFRAKRVPHP